MCKSDIYRVPASVINTMGRMWGSPRFMSPEEFEKGASIDEITNVYTLGAIAFEILGNNQIRTIEHWKAPQKLFEVAKRATNNERSQRYQSISGFYTAWKTALENNAK